MYAVIRAGGKQYRVAPGDVIRVEKSPAENGRVEFGDIVAVSAEEGRITRPEGNARVIGRVMEEGRGDKILVFHYKRKKQYKKLRGHRQAYTAVRIEEIAIDGQKFSAPAMEERKPKPTREAAPAAGNEVAPAETVRAQGAKAAPKKAAAKKSGGAAKKSGGAAKKSGGAAKKSSPKKKK